MAAKQRLEQIRSKIERLGRDSLDVVVNANRIVLQGIQKLAEQELKALSDYYKGAFNAVKSARRGDSNLKDMAVSQLDLMQETVNKVISNARESLSIVGDTRAELARLFDRDQGPLSRKALSQITAPAQKALEDVRKAAVKAQQSAAKTAKRVKKDIEKEIAYAEKKGKAAVKKGRAAAGEMGQSMRDSVSAVMDLGTSVPAAAKKAVKAKPSPASRARGATSKAKKGGPGEKTVASTMPPKKKTMVASTMPPKNNLA